MITTSKAVENMVKRSPFLLEVLFEDLASVSRIARKMRPEIEKKLLKDVSEEAIAMAIRRIKKNLKSPISDTEILKDTKNIAIRSNLTEFMFLNSPDVIKIQEQILKITENKKDSFFNILIGLTEVIIIVNSELEGGVEKILAKQKNILKVNDLSSITVKLSDKMTLTSPGVYYTILNALAWNGIAIIEVASIGWELNFLFMKDDIDRAFSVIKSLTS